MRILVDISDSQIRALGELCKRVHQPRAALIREAISEYLAHHSRAQEKDAFGLWGKDSADGIAYQRKARSEW